MKGQNPTFTVFTGPMFSSKTSRLLAALERFKLQGKRVMVFKPSVDDRYSDTDVVTHSGWRQPALVVKDGAAILQLLTEANEPPDVVAVDEAFMLSGVAEVLIWLYQSGISVVVSTLDLSSTAKSFHEVEKLLPWATHVEKCSAVCTLCGRDAHYTHKKQVATEDLIQVGGAETYEARCFRHHIAVDKRPQIHEG